MHPTQNLERIIVRAKKIVYKPPEFNHDFALLRSLLVAVLRHIREVHENAPICEAEDYQRRKKGEVDTQKYLNFPILRERAKYKRDCIMQDKIQRKQACQKEFPSHSKLTPGLYLLTCVSPHFVNKLTLATEQGTRSASGVYCSWRSTKTNISITAR